MLFLVNYASGDSNRTFKLFPLGSRTAHRDVFIVVSKIPQVTPMRDDILASHAFQLMLGTGSLPSIDTGYS